jgi:hypothetical protein
MLDNIELITKENISCDISGCYIDTFALYVHLPKEIEDHYKNVGIDKDSIFVEYWIDDDSFHYMFTLDNGDDIEVNDDFNCFHMNSIIKTFFNREYGE